MTTNRYINPTLSENEICHILQHKMLSLINRRDDTVREHVKQLEKEHCPGSKSKAYYRRRCINLENDMEQINQNIRSTNELLTKHQC